MPNVLETYHHVYLDSLWLDPWWRGMAPLTARRGNAHRALLSQCCLSKLPDIQTNHTSSLEITSLVSFAYFQPKHSCLTKSKLNVTVGAMPTYNCTIIK